MKKLKGGYKRTKTRSDNGSGNKNRVGSRNIWIIVGIVITLALCGGYFIADRNHIVAEDITNEVEEFDVTTIVLDDLENQEFNQSDALMKFSVSLLQTLHMEGEGGSVLLSPYSILTALAMTGNGAEGTTLEEMEQVLGSDIDSLNEFLYAYQERVLPLDEGYEVNVANSIWLRDEGYLSVQDEFLSTNKSYYGASIYKAAFDETTLNDINSWVYEETDGMVEKILDEINPWAVMYLVNAVSFQAEWDTIYKVDQVSEMGFTTRSGAVQTVDFLCGAEYEYIELENATGFSKPYEDEAYSFVAILPNEDMDTFIEGLDGIELMDAMESASNEKVMTYIPKFSFEYDVDLVDTLKAMGMKDAFEETEVDFTQMATSAYGNIYISRVLHKTFITVDEKGTEAGASTVVEVNTESTSMEEPKIVCLDRPFLFMIVDNELHAPIFMGIVENVE